MQSFLNSMIDTPSFTISAAAKLTGLHQQTIRSYEQRGLITPHRTPGGTRMYSWNDISTLQSISAMSCAGITIEGIHRILELEQKLVDAQKEMDSVIEENIELRAALRQERSNRRAFMTSKTKVIMTPLLPGPVDEETQND